MMKRKNTKYILALLVATISLASRCECGYTGPVYNNEETLVELEKKEKELLDALKPLYVAWKITTPKIATTKSATLFTDDEAQKEFAKEYTDPDHVSEEGSYAFEWKHLKKFYDADLTLVSRSTYKIAKALTENKEVLNATAPAPSDQVKAYRNKQKEFLENRKKMIETFASIIS